MNMRPSHMMQSFAPDADNTRLLRDAFGKFATGVTIVTCQTATGPVCMTVNSFTSVSLDPALVLWALDRNSTRFDAFANATHYAIHVLDHRQKDIALDAARDGSALARHVTTLSEQNVPLLADCLARFECERVAMHGAGDHELIVGRVLNAELREGQALTFFSGGFGEAG